VFERDGERVGSKHIKNRAEMGYSRKKLRPQKGSGRARMGDRGSPSRHDGGRAFGRQPGFDWSTQLPSQVYALAMRTALSYQYSKGNLLVVDEAEFVSGHSKAASIFIKGHGLEGKSMTIIVDEFRNNIHTATHSNKSTTNKIEVVSKEAVNVRDLLKPQRVIIEENALRYLAMIYAPRKQIRSSRPRAMPEIEEKFNRPLVIAQ
jgi:large subunit ribosomal protein L4